MSVAPGATCSHHDHASHQNHQDRHSNTADLAALGEKQTRRVMIVALATMFAEIGVGAWSGSLALLADGWHMATHVGALGLACLAYWFARRWDRAGRFAFGPGKVATLAGFANALLLGLAAIVMLAEAALRLATPHSVRFAEALPVAIIGLLVNIFSARMLAHADHEHDHNLRSAYLHVLADILTSVLAIAALGIGSLTGAARLDPLAAIVGAAVIIWWAAGLLRSAIPELVDLRLPSEPVGALLRERLESDGLTFVKEMTLWPLGSGRKGCRLGLATAGQRSVEDYRTLILATTHLDHVSIEIHRVELDIAQSA